MLRHPEGAGRVTVLLLAVAFAGAVVAGMLAGPGIGTAQSPDAPAQRASATATFAGGCFWCVESDFDHVPGVLGTVAGYTGGTLENPTYRQVSAGGTGHREAVEITYDPAVVDYATLLDVFWHSVDPTDGGGQFCDRGHSYTTAIYTHSDEQKRLAEESRQAIEGSGALDAPIATAIEPAGPFYPAEDYHQDY